MMKWRKDRLIVSSFSKCFYFLIRNSFNFSFCRQINDQMLEDRNQIRKRISFLIRTILKVVHGYFYFISSMQSELQLSNVVTFFFFFKFLLVLNFRENWASSYSIFTSSQWSITFQPVASLWRLPFVYNLTEEQVNFLFLSCLRI